MSAPVIIYDTSLNKVAYLPKAFDVAYHLRANEVGRAWFSVTTDDPHISEIQELRYAEIYDGDRRIELFRILTSWKASDMTQRFECEHVLGTLMDDELDDIFYAGAIAGTEDAIDDILDEQGTARWTQGTCAFSEDYLYEWPRGTSLLKAILDIPKRFQSGYFWTYDTSSYPWTINLIEPPTTVTAYVDYGRNMKSISRKKDLSGLVTKLYPHGANAGADQIGITTVEPSSNAYITNNTGTYGTIVHHWTDQRYTTEAELYAAAVAHLAEISEPAYTYQIDQADVYRLTGESIDSYSIGTLVQVDNPELDITTDVRVMEIKKSDVTGKQGDISLTFANKGEEFDLSPKLGVNDLSAVSVTDIPGGIMGALPAVPSEAGLYASTSHFGFSDGTSWKTYMDSDGKWFCSGSGNYLSWDPAGTGTLSIKGDVEITGTLLASQILISGTTTLADWRKSGDLTKIDGVSISDNTITAEKINVTSLSAISADIGSVTSGTVTGANIRTAASGARVQLNADSDIGGTSDTIEFYDINRIRSQQTVSGITCYASDGSLGFAVGYSTFGRLWVYDTSGNAVVDIDGSRSSYVMKILQDSTSAAVPCLLLDQDDTSEPFITFTGTTTGSIDEGTSSTTSIYVSAGAAGSETKYRIALYPV